MIRKSRERRSPALVAGGHSLTDTTLDLLSLAASPLLVQDRGEMGWLDWRSYFTQFRGDFEFANDQYEFNNYALTLQAAMEGKGVALAWQGLTDSHLANNWLVALEGMKFRSGKGYYLAFSVANPVADHLRQWAAGIVGETGGSQGGSLHHTASFS